MLFCSTNTIFDAEVKWPEFNEGHTCGIVGWRRTERVNVAAETHVRLQTKMMHGSRGAHGNFALVFQPCHIYV